MPSWNQLIQRSQLPTIGIKYFDKEYSENWLNNIDNVSFDLKKYLGMAFPPLVSSTPPPLDNFEPEDDEFGDFATGGIDGLSVSSESPHKLPTPLATPIKIREEEGESPVEETAIEQEIEPISLVLEHPQTNDVILNTDNHCLHADYYGYGDFESADIWKAVETEAKKEEEEEEAGEDLDINEIRSDIKENLEFNSVSIEIKEEAAQEEIKLTVKEPEAIKEEEKGKVHEEIIESEIENVDFDFEDFKTAESVEVTLEDTKEEVDDDFGDFGDFGDFEDFQEAVELPEISPQAQPPVADDFGDFESSEINFIESITRIENKNASNKIEDILRTMFPCDSALITEASVSALIGGSDKLWTNIKNVEESHALNFHWNNSSSNNALLEALGIDSRNILFGPRWNPNVPRFAANLGFAPLEPIKASADVKVQDNSEKQQTSEEVPAAQFDWNSAGLVNPLEAKLDQEKEHEKKLRKPEEVRKKELRKKSKSSVKSEVGLPTTQESITITDRFGRQMPAQAETVKVLKKLPDLSFLSARSLMLERDHNQLAG